MYIFMYPYIWSVPLLGIGIVIALCVFLLVFLRQSQLYRLSSSFFLQHIWWYYIIIFLCSSYFYYLFEEFILIPLHRKQILLYFSPTGFQFHSIWTFIGIFLTSFSLVTFYKRNWQLSLFLKVFFDASMITSVIFGLFLLFSDNFFGVGTHFFSFPALTIHSQRAAYESVIPLGLYFSLMSLLVYGALVFRRHKNPHSDGIELLWWAVWFLWLVIITLFQQYPRHLVIMLFDKTFDMKQYFFFCSSVWFVIVYLKYFFFNKNHIN